MTDELKRAIKTPGAILMGLRSIIGTGIFVSIAIATQVSGNGIVIAIVIAAVLATFNGLSSAQLAAAPTNTAIDLLTPTSVLRQGGCF